MPGIATLFQALDLTVAQLDKQNLHRFSNVMKTHSGYAHLGVIGASIGDFLPADPIPGAQPQNYVRIWKIVFRLLADQPSGPGGEPARPGFRSVLTAMRDNLNKLTKIADDEDVFALMDLSDAEKDQMKQNGEDLKVLVQELGDRATDILKFIAIGLRPKVVTSSTTEAVPPPTAWQSRDFLHWKRTGRFAHKLIEKAEATNDARLKAYAYGYLIGYACKVCASPFVNSIVGGPFRTQWWRQRFVRNYIDAWVYGFYTLEKTTNTRPTFAPDGTPSVPYKDWPKLWCRGNLHKKLELDPQNPVDPATFLQMVGTTGRFDTQPAIVPADFAQRWFEAFQETYTDGIPTGVTAQSLNGAYVMTYLMLWFQTSGAVLGVLGCAPEDPTPPGDCGKSDDELDPFKADEKGNPIAPPAAEVDKDVDKTAIICGLILAALGILGVFGGALAAGGTAIGIGLKVAHDNVDWDHLKCLFYWYRQYLYNAVTGFQRLIALAGLGYPDPAVFTEDPQVIQVLTVKETLESARSLVKSRIRSPFPSRAWVTLTEQEKKDLDGNDPLKKKLVQNTIFTRFEKDPTVSDPNFESPNTTAYFTEAFPSFFLDDPSNPLGNGDLKTAGGFPSRQQPATGERLGNVAAAAVDLFVNLDKPLPSWNLDGDRGFVWFNWQLQRALNPITGLFPRLYDPGNVLVEPEP
jgi:hypothetical protein